jgi:hypothetical protein
MRRAGQKSPPFVALTRGKPLDPYIVEGQLHRPSRWSGFQLSTPKRNPLSFDDRSSVTYHYLYQFAIRGLKLKDAAAVFARFKPFHSSPIESNLVLVLQCQQVKGSQQLDFML